jgi:hypothetical protein
MSKKLNFIIIIAFCCLNVVFAQDPPPLPDAPNQGPINGLVSLAFCGILIAAKSYFNRSK